MIELVLFKLIAFVYDFIVNSFTVFAVIILEETIDSVKILLAVFAIVVYAFDDSVYRGIQVITNGTEWVYTTGFLR